MLIFWLEAAELDAIGILEYIAQDNITAAYGVYEAIQQQVSHLAEHPKLGRIGRVKGTRELVVSGTPYIVAYRIQGEIIQILRVLHGAQKWERQFLS